MKVTRIYSGEDGQSHFEDLDIPLTDTGMGQMSGGIATSAVFFRTTHDVGDLDFHVAPRRQFVVHLAGRVEIETGQGESRQFGVGDILLADDTTGQGHISREVEGPRFQIFVGLDDSVDLDRWR